MRNGYRGSQIKAPWYICNYRGVGRLGVAGQRLMMSVARGHANSTRINQESELLVCYTPDSFLGFVPVFFLTDGHASYLVQEITFKHWASTSGSFDDLLQSARPTPRCTNFHSFDMLSVCIRLLTLQDLV